MLYIIELTGFPDRWSGKTGRLFQNRTGTVNLSRPPKKEPGKEGRGNKSPENTTREMERKMKRKMTGESCGGRFFRELLLTGAVFFLLAAPAGPLSAEFVFDPEPPEELLDDSGWHSHQFPLPEDNIFVWDKSFPLPEVLKKLSSPTHYEYMPETVAPRVVSSIGFPLPVNSYVEKYVNYFTRERPQSFRYLYRRSGLYEDLIISELRRRRMPEELIYLCMIESAFQPRAVSIANAKGLWQFIYSTGRRYNLEINYWVDERYDPVKSTRAALDYLTDLYEMFGDWHLAAASYNCGEGFVDRRLRSTGCGDYWCLIDMGRLPSETRHYVPKIVASAIVGQNLERYGFYNLQKLPSIKWSTVRVDDAVDLRTIAQCAGASLEEIQRLNPSILRFSTPPGVRGFEVHIPYGRTEQFNRAFARLTPEQRFAFKKHKVERGQTLHNIAAGYGASPRLLTSVNNLPATASLREGQIIIVPVPKDTRFDPGRRPAPDPKSIEDQRKTSPPPTRPARTDRRAASPASKPPPSPPRQIHVVEPGDTLWAIAKLYETSVDDIKKSNPGMDERSIYIGDELVIPSRVQPKPRESSTPAARPKPGSTRTITHTVREGDICYWIARHYGIHSQDIIQKNNLDPQCTIRPGQEITLSVPKDAPTSPPPLERPAASAPRQDSIPLRPTKKPAAPPAGAKKVSYTFDCGDSLWQVARNHDVRVAEILAWNGLDESYVPQPGQTVAIYINPDWKVPPKPKASSPTATDKKAAPAPPAQPTGTRGKPVQYTVKPGDSLWLIARRHDVHVHEIVSWNGLDSEIVREGQLLTIRPGPAYQGPAEQAAPRQTRKEAPAPKPASATPSRGQKKIAYTVKPGDSLWLIARHHNVRVNDILAWNELPEGTHIQPGQQLVVFVAADWKPPAGGQSKPPAAPQPASQDDGQKEVGPRGKPITYVVQEGDSLWGIARKHDVYSSEIREWNNLSSDTLRPGQKLTIRPGPGYQP